jgi:hypothetical protein
VTSTATNPSLTSLYSLNISVVCWEARSSIDTYYNVYIQLIDEQTGTHIYNNDYQVNNYGFHATKCDITSLNNDNFAVVWQNSEQDSSGFGVYAQIFDSLGTKVIASASTNEKDLKEYMKWDSIEIEVNLNIGHAAHTVYTCDFTKEYVSTF